MGEIKGRFFISNKEKPCFFCGKKTPLIEISSEKRICSKECLKKLDDSSSINKAVYVRFCAFNYEQFDIIDKLFTIDENMLRTLEKASEENFCNIFIRFANITGDYSLLNSKSLDYLIEEGDITCFEKNKKKILNKSKVFDCYLNVEMKTLSSYLCFQLIDIKTSSLKEFSNIGVFNKRLN